MPPVANPSRAGVTPDDIAAARQHRDDLEARHQELEANAKSQLAEMKAANGGKLPVTDEVMTQVEELYAETDKVGADLDKARAHVENLLGKAFGRDTADRMPSREQAARGFAGVSLGSALVDSEEFLAAFAANQVVRLEDIELADAAATAAMLAPGNPTLGAMFDGSPTVPTDQRLFPPVGIPERPVRLLDLITIGSTDTDSVAYTEEITRTLDVSDPGLGQPLPESTIEVEGREVSVIDPGTTLPVPTRTLEDRAQLRTWLEGRLRRGVERDTEERVLAGLGVGNDFEGILNRANIGEYEIGTASATESKADAIHRGITLVRVRYEDEPDAIVYRPESLEEFLLEKNDYGYVNSGGPFGTLPSSMWGKRAVTSTVLDVDADQAIVGFWPEAHLWMRRGIVLREFEQHADYARRRLVLLRVDYRAAFKVLQPRAFAVVSMTAAP